MCARRWIAFCSPGTAPPGSWWTKSWRFWRYGARPISFLALPAGKVSFSLLKLIPETSLFLEVEKLIHQVQHTGEPARQDRIPFDRDGRLSEVSVEVMPLHARQKNSLLVLFEGACPPRQWKRRRSLPQPVERTTLRTGRSPA